MQQQSKQSAPINSSAGKRNEYEDRLKKLELLKQTGVNPYPAKIERDFTIGDVLNWQSRRIKF
ncbi:hypothetical protein COU00_01155 [Candidatus Falkowbacteria bacterium CG10_big_fil_rev_8_21_14_0_10_43_11]|uniref:Lysine--tRNA ligase n=1 Tax=Candidatus Falkowbacteria bacterium CG10_big_fil_rev_8_21_14_0_10_43_11 TaxID=1974568 RepID=A0A2M6WMU6_9BACT|nr:MAG: hypothetical protein COU00_01155 [Candidatus Falkowbacteria bacterium CG10_big_fil_rev_8_21_14_0_10_43_11]